MTTKRRTAAMRRRIALLASLTALVLGAAGVAVATGATTAQPGVTATSIKLGGTFPLTGPAALYATIPVAAKAYFNYVNDRGGVNGRKIDFVYYDDQYDPSQTVAMTQKLVGSDRIFADYLSLGTAMNLAIRPYLNKLKIPQVLISTGDSYWGSQYKQFPWTIGYQPDYPGEARIYAKFINAKVPQAKIAILYQNDAYGKQYLEAFKAGLGANGAKKVVATEPFDVTAPDVIQQMLKLKGSGANVFIDFATPSPSIKALVTATKIGWHPAASFVNNISASTNLMLIAAKSGADINGVITATWIKNAPDPAMAKDPAIKLYKSILAKYYPSAGLADQNVYNAVSNAWTMVYALKRAGNPPTRAGLLQALTHLNVVNPFLQKGITMKTTPTERFPIDQLILARWKGGVEGSWSYFGNLYANAR